MVEINLLPWRLQQFHYERSVLMRYSLVGLVLALICVSGCHVLLSAENLRQAARVQVLRTRLPAENNNAATIQDDGRDYFSAVDILNLFAAAASDPRACYTQFIREQGHITLTGSAKSLISVTHVLRSLGASAGLSHVQLGEVKRQAGSESLQFSLDAREA